MTTKNFSIRNFQQEDIVAVTKIYNESIAIGDATCDVEFKTVSEMQERFFYLGDRETALVLEVDNRVAGWGMIKRYSDCHGYRFCCETAIYLARSEVRKGYGSVLKKAVIAKCRELNYHHLVATIFANNKASIAYNRKLGYEDVGVQKNIAYMDGKWVDVLIMQLILENDNDL